MFDVFNHFVAAIVLNIIPFISFLEYSVNISYDRSGSNTPLNIVNPQKQGPPKNPPMFITV